ncbi:conserved hypothetical protein [Candidatus Nitrosotenuis uzonensis]|uniref:Uncharacterized protein n=2 Tax=Candidatus Nitrosotenuis uzonensis TaxID=1407055 RepID=A0A812EYU6_9ARCH|nr:conserved hypothetical protein [Candidatus Nitrosotenuis uzonensis]
MMTFMIFGAYAQQIPDYYKPYAPIYTDKEVYTWTDKVRITIVAPSWNADRHSIDTIGDETSHAVKISTSTKSLSPYRLTETSQNSGVFTGEVILTGFSHDVDGDGRPDTNPRTVGAGPTGGMLETKRDDGLTISFEFADGVVLTNSAKVSWNSGTIRFSNPSYLISDTVVVRVVDPDMNLNPEAPDTLTVDIMSDSDSAGVSVSATETLDDSGIFEVAVILTQTGKSSGNRLHALPGDAITAIYKDRTLPTPFSISDHKDVIATATVGSITPQTQRITLGDLFFTDFTGNRIEQLTQSQQVQIVNRVTNNEDYQQDFVCIMQISDASNTIISIAWISGQLRAGQSFDVSQSWIPKESGTYKIETFVWKSLDDPHALSQNSEREIRVQ